MFKQGSNMYELVQQDQGTLTDLDETAGQVRAEPKEPVSLSKRMLHFILRENLDRIKEYE